MENTKSGDHREHVLWGVESSLQGKSDFLNRQLLEDQWIQKNSRGFFIGENFRLLTTEGTVTILYIKLCKFKNFNTSPTYIIKGIRKKSAGIMKNYYSKIFEHIDMIQWLNC
jgi:hypothetical protein